MSEKNEGIAEEILKDHTVCNCGEVKLKIEQALDSKDSESAHLRTEYERQAKYALEHGLDAISHATVLKIESAQLRGEVERLKQADVFCRERHIPDPHQFKSLQDKLASQSLLIEKLRDGICQIARGQYGEEYGNSPDTIATKLLSLLPQDEKKEGG